jgi:hypothetical protein
MRVVHFVERIESVCLQVGAIILVTNLACTFVQFALDRSHPANCGVLVAALQITACVAFILWVLWDMRRTGQFMRSLAEAGDPCAQKGRLFTLALPDRERASGDLCAHKGRVSGWCLNERQKVNWLLGEARAGGESLVVIEGAWATSPKTPEDRLLLPVEFTPRRPVGTLLVWVMFAWALWYVFPHFVPAAPEPMIFRKVFLGLTVASMLGLATYLLYTLFTQVRVFQGGVEVRRFGLFGDQPKRTTRYLTSAPGTVFYANVGVVTGRIGGIRGICPLMLIVADGKRRDRIPLTKRLLPDVLARLESKPHVAVPAD